MNHPDRGNAETRLLTAEMKRREAALYLFRKYLGQMQAQSGVWQKIQDDASLHQFRISLRRCRVLLKVFSVDADAHGGKSLRLGLTRVADKLGAVRDLDVIQALLSGSLFGRCGRNDEELAPLLQQINRQRNIQLCRAETYRAGASRARVADLTERFLDRWSRDEDRGDAQSIRDFLNREFRLHCRWIMRAEWMAKSNTSETLHAFRIKLRRLRYLGDLLNELASREQKKVFKRIHECEQNLGQVHDVDMGLDFMDSHPVKTPAVLRREMESLRMKKLGKFRKKWRKSRKIMRDLPPIIP